MPDNENAIQSRPAAVFAPDQVISVLIGADSVALNGFGGIPVKLPFWVPVISHLNPSLTSPAAARVRAAANWITAGSTVVGALALACLGYWAGNVQKDITPSSRSQAGWLVKAVEKDAVVVQIGSAQSRIPVGSMLPNGETLRSVDPARRSFATDNLVTAVKL